MIQNTVENKFQNLYKVAEPRQNGTEQTWVHFSPFMRNISIGYVIRRIYQNLAKI